MLAGLLAGCATKESASSAPRRLKGVEEYKQLAAQALHGVQAALQSLDQVSAQAEPCSPKVVAAFSNQVQRLQVESIRVRARSQAIQARGDAYFQAWSENIARIQDPRVRELAERFHPQLEQCYLKVKVASREAGEAFRPFLSGLRELRTELENKPDVVATDSARELIRATREHGQEVVKKLGEISNECQAITTMLTPGQTAARK